MNDKAPPFKLGEALEPTFWVNPTQPYSQGQLWVPMSWFVDTWEEKFHDLLLRDKVRMEAFKTAISTAVDDLIQRRGPDSKTVRILDIGTGTGIWAYHCWNCLSKYPEVLPRSKVYALEGSGVTFANLTKPCIDGVMEVGNRRFGNRRSPKNIDITDNRIQYLNVTSFEFAQYICQNKTLFETFDHELFDAANQIVHTVDKPNSDALFDLIICECVGGLGDDEGISAILDKIANSLAKKDAIIIPNSISVWIAPIVEPPESTNIGMHQQFKSAVADVTLGKQPNSIKTICDKYDVVSLFNNSNTPYFDVIIPRSYEISEPKELIKFKFDRKSWSCQKEYDVKNVRFQSLSIKSKAYLIGFKAFIKMKLYKDVELDTGDETIETSGERRTSDCWKHTYLPLTEPIQVDIRNTIELRYRKENIGNSDDDNTSGSFKYSWATGVLSSDGEYQAISAQSCYLEHKLNKDKSDQYTPDLYDLYRVLGALGDIFIGLCVAEIFGIVLVVLPNGDYTKISVYMITFLFLIRVVHSFHNIGANLNLDGSERTLFKRQTIGYKVWLTFFRLLPSLFTIIYTCYLLKLGLAHADTAIWICVGPLLIFFSLIGWDILAFHVILDEENKRGSEKRKEWNKHSLQMFQTTGEPRTDSKSIFWLDVVGDAVRVWLVMDCFVALLFSIGVTYFIVYIVGATSRAPEGGILGASIKALGDIEPYLPYITSIFLAVTFGVDYYKNKTFYMTRKGALLDRAFKQ